MYVKPAPGMQVRDPHRPRSILPAAGRAVPDYDIEWNRLLNVGDVVLADPPPADEADTDTPAAQE